MACNQLEKPKPAPFYAETAPPQKKEFRWSNGKMPKSFDPALASAPPETDVVRAIFEGLTDTDPKTLNAVSAIAIDWKSTDEFKTWTFNLRRDARWSNGERVTAQNFVRSWKRLAEMKGKVAHPELLQNIVGMKVSGKETRPSVESDGHDILLNPLATEDPQFLPSQTNSNSSTILQKLPETNSNTSEKSKIETVSERKYGVEAVDNYTLKISLIKPDKDFPALVAHPIFRPIYSDGKEFETGRLNADIVTSGAFRVFSVGQDGITLDRAENYWNKESVEIERVRFVPTENAEKALEAYSAGEVDAVTNADFEPLALKLLAPYEDFQRTPHGALNFYEFNLKKPPFDDRRVREALAISIERERLTEDEMGGASQPALSFLPFSNKKTKLAQDPNRAKNLLAETGFANGENFPTIMLLVNRNNVQQRIARSVAKMWKQNLNIETEIIIKDSTEITSAWASEDYALVRRGTVIPTTNEWANMSAIFLPRDELILNATNNKSIETSEIPLQNENSNTAVSAVTSEQSIIKGDADTMPSKNPKTKTAADSEMILTEAQAIVELHAIPLYFSTSYSLVKPYIQGFDVNVLDAPSLKNVKIDNGWQLKKPKSEL
ncbi:MAG: peptide ABC transporter substrate-binding protein [Acidobacteriota bacterium]|nr:peptide ABC transporter substrate-binding protein [Acidobacteriota bacterium]